MTHIVHLRRLRVAERDRFEHELLTPLAAIRALAEILRDHPDMPVEQRSLFVDRLLDEQARLHDAVEEVLAGDG